MFFVYHSPRGGSLFFQDFNDKRGTVLYIEAILLFYCLFTCTPPKTTNTHTLTPHTSLAPLLLVEPDKKPNRYWTMKRLKKDAMRNSYFKIKVEKKRRSSSTNVLIFGCPSSSSSP